MSELVVPTHAEILRALKALRARGLPGCRDIQIDALWRVVESVRPSAGGDPVALHETLGDAIDDMPVGDLRTAAGYLFGLAQGTHGKRPTDLRKLAAAVYGVALETFARNQEKLVLSTVADRLLHAVRSTQQTPRDKTGENYVQALLVAFDIEAWSRTDRTDDDRGALREVAQNLILEVLGTVGVTLDDLSHNDLGDGVVIAITRGFPGREIVTRVLPTLERRLLDYNSNVAQGRRLRMRLVLSQGEVRIDALPITGTGMHSEAMTNALRLLDIGRLRDVLKKSPGRFIAVALSEPFYQNVVYQHLRSLDANFERIEVKVKHQTLPAYLLHDPLAIDGDTARIAKASGSKGRHLSTRPRGQPILIGQLSRRGLYISTTDIYNHQLYALAAGTTPLINHIETGLLLSEFTVIHSADPYRSAQVLAVLQEYQQFIVSGRLVFLLASSVEDIERDYEDYITQKSSEYLPTGYGLDDIESLSTPLDDPTRLASTIKLLSYSPHRIHRGFGATEAFRDYVERDLRPSERIVTTEVPLQKLSNSNLTLNQLIHLSKVTKRNHKSDKLENFIPDSTRESLIANIRTHVGRNTFSRQSLLSMLRTEFAEEWNVAPEILAGIERRVHLLHLSATVKPLPFTEFTPRRDERSPFYYRHLLDHLAALGGHAARRSFGPQMVADLLGSPNWPEFANYHLRSTAEIMALRQADMDPKRDLFWVRGAGDYSKIRNTVVKWWR